jgi:hypothetical protein
MHPVEQSKCVAWSLPQHDKLRCLRWAKLRRRGEVLAVFDGAPPCGAAGLLVGEGLLSYGALDREIKICPVHPTNYSQLFR